MNSLILSKRYPQLQPIRLHKCNDENKNPSISDEQLNRIGNKLAAWGNSNCKTIAINEIGILWQGSNAGGCGEVYFEFTGTFDPVNFEEREDAVQSSLRELINSSNCEQAVLIDNISGIEPNTNEQQIAQHLECLGTVKIVDGAFGNE